MFAHQQDDKIKEWSKLIDRYIALHKYIKDVGKIAIKQGRIGFPNKEVQIKISESLSQADRTLNQLKDFFKPCLTEVDASEIYQTENYQLHELKKKLAELEKKNGLLNKGSNNPFALDHEKLLLEKQSLQHQLSELENHCRFLTEQLAEFVSTKRDDGENGSDKTALEDAEAGIEMFYLKRQEQLEETLKTQNDLIYDLKKQLEDAVKERENYKSLNKYLEAEIQKKEAFKFLKSENKECDVRNKDNNYSSRSTLKVEDVVLRKDIHIPQIVKISKGPEKFAVADKQVNRDLPENVLPAPLKLLESEIETTKKDIEAKN